LLFVRLVHFHGTDAKLRVFKHERWIPAKWIELHQIYVRSCELSCDRQPMALPAAGAGAQAWSVEQEYLYVLLVHQLNTGNLGPAEVDWASSQLRAWSRRLALEQIPKSVEGFFVDLAGRSGLIRRNGNDRGSVLRYVDTTPLAARLSSWSDPMWEVKDRSVAGLRIAATGGIGQSLSLGALVAVRQSDADAWLLGVVRRLNKVSNEEVEAGVNIIADRIVAVMLAAKRRPNEDMGYVVDGLDLSTLGDRFEGLYLPPPSRPDKPLAMKTLIVPTSEYAEGRNVILSTANSVYTLAFRHLVEQRPEWSWATVQIAEKHSRGKG